MTTAKNFLPDVKGYFLKENSEQASKTPLPVKQVLKSVEIECLAELCFFPKIHNG